MKKAITITAFLLCGWSAISQTSRLDSLLTELPQTTDEERITLLHEIVKAAWTTEPDQVICYAREAIELSHSLKNLRLLSTSYRILGGLYNYMSEIDSGKYFKQQALLIALQLEDPNLLASSYNNLGVTSQTLGNYVEALEYFYRAYLISKTIPDYNGLPIVLANISEVYYDLNEYDSATRYANMAVEITSSQPNTSRHLLTLNALARPTLANDDYAIANSLYSTIIIISAEIGEKRYSAYASQGLGRLNAGQNFPITARMHYNKAVSLFTELDDQAYLSEIYADLAQLNQYTQPDSAFYYVRKSMAIAADLGLSDVLMDDYQLLVSLFGNQKNFDSLQHYQARYREMLKVKRKENNLVSIQGMFAKLTDEQMRIRLNQQALALEQKTFETNFFVAFAVLTILFAGMIYRYYRKQKRLGNYLTDVNAEIVRQNELIDNKNKKLSALNSEKNDLINIVAHDLKNPLSNIIHSVQLIKGDDESAKEAALVIIEGSATRLSEMVTKILDVESIEKGLSNLNLLPVNLSNVVESLRDDIETQAHQKDIVMHLDITKDIMVLGDETYIYQVMENIVSNAIKYSPFKKNIYIVLKRINKVAKVEIKDEGPGISPKEQKKLFQMYQKLSSTPTADEHSSGLGLSIAKKYVDAMNGKIWCKSKLEQGTSFYVQLPLA